MAPIWDDVKGALGRFTGAGSADDDSTQDDTTQADEVMESASEQPRMVQCVKLGRELPGLERPPFPGELGRRIFENVSRPAFDLWGEQQTLIINHYGLNLIDPAAKQFLMEQMEAFFFADQAHVPEGWVPEDQAGDLGPQGKGGLPGPQAKKGGGSPVPQGKGGGPPAPQRK